MRCLRSIPVLTLVFAAALAPLPALLSAAVLVQAGQWEFTTSHVDAEPDSIKHCISAEEAASINGGSKTARAYAEKKAGGRCTVNEYTINGDLMTYSVTCGQATVRARISYHAGSSEGDLYTKKGAEAEVVTHVKARRLGDCPAEGQSHR
jgi:hypothetical protein